MNISEEIDTLRRLGAYLPPRYFYEFRSRLDALAAATERAETMERRAVDAEDHLYGARRHVENLLECEKAAEAKAAAAAERADKILNNLQDEVVQSIIVREQLAAAEAKADTLAKYVEHKSNCVTQIWATEPCNCGLDVALAAAGEAADEETEDEHDARIVSERDATDTGERITLGQLIEEHLAGGSEETR